LSSFCVHLSSFLMKIPDTNLKYTTQDTNANQYTTMSSSIQTFRTFLISCKFTTVHYYTLTRCTEYDVHHVPFFSRRTGNSVSKGRGPHSK
jgi:hypothetical protein